MKKEEFKVFVRNNPKLINYVRNNKMTWQGFYEMYDLYGSDSSIWDEYIKEEIKIEKSDKGIYNLTLSEVVKWVKNVDLDSLEQGIGNIQKVLGVVQDFTKKDNIESNTYKPRPLYKHFED